MSKTGDRIIDALGDVLREVIDVRSTQQHIEEAAMPDDKADTKTIRLDITASHEQRIEAAMFIDGGYVVHASHGGSWIIEQQRNDPSRVWKRRGFTNWGDMLAWLAMAHDALDAGLADPANYDITETPSSPPSPFEVMR